MRPPLKIRVAAAALFPAGIVPDAGEKGKREARIQTGRRPDPAGRAAIFSCAARGIGV